MPSIAQHSPLILLRSPNWVGDAVMATPVPRALRRSLPACRIHVLAKAWVAPVWERHPDVERVIVLPGRGFGSWLKLVADLRRAHYDLALVLPDSFSAAWLAFWSGARVRVGRAGQWRRRLLTQAAPRAGAARVPRPEAYLSLARLAGADADVAREWVFTLKISPEEAARAATLLAPAGPGRRVGLAPGSVAPSRRWPAASYAALAERLQAAGCAVVLVGSGADAAVARAVAERMQKPPLVLAGATGLREAAAVIGRLDLLVSNDSGSVHLAYAQDVPVLVPQGAADPQVTGPFGPHSRVVRAAGPECAPCVRNECERGDLACMTGISVDAVWAEAQAMLGMRRTEI